MVGVSVSQLQASGAADSPEKAKELLVVLARGELNAKNLVQNVLASGEGVAQRNLKKILDKVEKRDAETAKKLLVVLVRGERNSKNLVQNVLASGEGVAQRNLKKILKKPKIMRFEEAFRNRW